MKFLMGMVAAVDGLNGLVGRVVSWFVLPVVLLSFSVVTLRYAFGIGFPWLQETYTWLNGAVIMLAAAYVLREGGHVRVDLFYKGMGARARAWVDLLGVWALLMPMMATIFFLSLPIVERSWRIRESSPTSDGLGFLFVLKASVLVFSVLVALQGLSMSGKALLTLAGRDEMAGAGGRDAR